MFGLIRGCLSYKGSNLYEEMSHKIRPPSLFHSYLIPLLTVGILDLSSSYLMLPLRKPSCLSPYQSAPNLINSFGLWTPRVCSRLSQPIEFQLIKKLILVKPRCLGRSFGKQGSPRELKCSFGGLVTILSPSMKICHADWSTLTPIAPYVRMVGSLVYICSLNAP